MRKRGRVYRNRRPSVHSGVVRRIREHREFPRLPLEDIPPEGLRPRAEDIVLHGIDDEPRLLFKFGFELSAGPAGVTGVEADFRETARKLFDRPGEVEQAGPANDQVRRRYVEDWFPTAKHEGCSRFDRPAGEEYRRFARERFEPGQVAGDCLPLQRPVDDHPERTFSVMRTHEDNRAKERWFRDAETRKEQFAGK